MTRILRGSVVLSSVVDGRSRYALDFCRGPMDELAQRVLKSFHGQDIDVTVMKHRAPMSDRSRRYYFSVIVPLIAEYCGYEKDEMHEALAWKFLRIEDDDLTGAPRRKHLPALDSPEGAEYLDRCIRFGAELGVYIPAPGEVVA